ncbi:MAG: hypothetical protein WBD20_12860 [Pirellulaceae bacterium]
MKPDIENAIECSLRAPCVPTHTGNDPAGLRIYKCFGSGEYKTVNSGLGGPLLAGCQIRWVANAPENDEDPSGSGSGSVTGAGYGDYGYDSEPDDYYTGAEEYYEYESDFYEDDSDYYPDDTAYDEGDDQDNNGGQLSCDQF